MERDTERKSIPITITIGDDDGKITIHVDDIQQEVAKKTHDINLAGEMIDAMLQEYRKQKSEEADDTDNNIE